MRRRTVAWCGTTHGEPHATWMIGNSPKSDINPALAAGLNAVFIPHDFTWVLEHEVVTSPPEGQRIFELAPVFRAASSTSRGRAGCYTKQRWQVAPGRDDAPWGKANRDLNAEVAKLADALA